MTSLQKIKELLELKGDSYTGKTIDDIRENISILIQSQIPQTKYASLSDKELSLVTNSLAVDVLITRKSNGDKTLEYSQTSSKKYGGKLSSEVKNLEIDGINSWINGSVKVFQPVLKEMYDNGLVSRNNIFMTFNIIGAMLLDGLDGEEVQLLETHLDNIYYSGPTENESIPDRSTVVVDPLDSTLPFEVATGDWPLPVDRDEDTTGFSSDQIFWRNKKIDNEKRFKNNRYDRDRLGLN